MLLNSELLAVFYFKTFVIICTGYNSAVLTKVIAEIWEYSVRLGLTGQHEPSDDHPG